jgi:hypothetical protein
MARLDIQGLIDQVLSMAKDSMEEKKKRDYRNTVNKEYQELTGTTPELNLAKENNAGQLARQQLQQVFQNETNKRNYNLDLYKTQISENVNRFDSQTKRMEADWKMNQPQKGVLGEQLTALTAVVNDPEATPEDKQWARSALRNSIGQQPMAQQKPGQPQQANGGFDISAIPNEHRDAIRGAISGASKKGGEFGYNQQTGEVQAVYPDGSKEIIYTPTKKKKGAPSMEFVSEETLNKRRNQMRMKETEEAVFGKKDNSLRRLFSGQHAY